MNKAVLFLFPTPIADGDINLSLPQKNLELLLECDYFVVEEIRTARRFLRKAGYNKNFDEVVFFELNEHTKEEDISEYLIPISQGNSIGLMSEAGLPCVADPGAMIVSMAQSKGIEIIPLVGPSSIMMSLMASGFNGQNFAFVGYLPIDKAQRAKRIKALETIAFKENQTQIFIEAPYRNNSMLESLISILNPNTKICVGVDIMLPTQNIISHTAQEWEKIKIDLHKRNTVFLLYK